MNEILLKAALNTIQSVNNTSVNEALENTFEKNGKNARNQHSLIFLQCFKTQTLSL